MCCFVDSNIFGKVSTIITSKSQTLGLHYCKYWICGITELKVGKLDYLVQSVTTVSASLRSLQISFIISVNLNFHSSFSQFKCFYIPSLLCIVCVIKNNKESVTGSNWRKTPLASYKWFYSYLKVEIISERRLRNNVIRLHKLEIYIPTYGDFGIEI